MVLDADAVDGDDDGMTNNEERLWGLDPTDRASHEPVTVPLNTGGSLIYSRRDPALTGATYSVWTSADLHTWTEDTGALQTPGTVVNGRQSVHVTLDPALLSGPQLFVRLRATE